MAQDVLCQENNVGDARDEIFYQGECKSVEEICSTNGLIGRNVNYCFNSTSNLEIPINEIITRKLAAEEFF